MTVRTCERPLCGNVYEVTHPARKYCSVACRNKANRVAHSTAGSSTNSDLTLDVDRVQDIDNLLLERGLNPDDWVVVSVTLNDWQSNAGEGEVLPLKQLKVNLRPKNMLGAFVQPPPVVEVKTVRNFHVKENVRCKRIFIYGDDQRPDVDETFAELKLKFIFDNDFDEIIDLGDGMDMPSISTHKVNPARDWTVQECVDSYANWLFSLRTVAPDSRIRILADNHATGRLRDYQLAKAAALYGVRPADVKGLTDDLEPLWSLRRMLRLDEMDIEYVAPRDDDHYAESHVEIIPGELVAIHGYRTGTNLGRKFIDDYGCSVIYGHQHGQNVYATDQHRRGVGDRRRIYALGVGCGANIHGGGGYAPGADWQNSALTVSVFKDGGWSFDHVGYANGVLTWRDKQYT